MSPLAQQCVCPSQPSTANGQASSKLGRLKKPFLSWVFYRVATYSDFRWLVVLNSTGPLMWLQLSDGSTLDWTGQDGLARVCVCWNFSFLLYMPFSSCQPSWISYMTFLGQCSKRANQKLQRVLRSKLQKSFHCHFCPSLLAKSRP